MHRGRRGVQLVQVVAVDLDLDRRAEAEVGRPLELEVGPAPRSPAARAVAAMTASSSSRCRYRSSCAPGSGRRSRLGSGAGQRQPGAAGSAGKVSIRVGRPRKHGLDVGQKRSVISSGVPSGSSTLKLNSPWENCGIRSSPSRGTSNENRRTAPALRRPPPTRAQRAPQDRPDRRVIERQGAVEEPGQRSRIAGRDQAQDHVQHEPAQLHTSTSRDR